MPVKAVYLDWGCKRNKLQKCSIIQLETHMKPCVCNIKYTIGGLYFIDYVVMFFF